MKVFVSSTYEDLREHRQAVEGSLARMKLQYSAMEYFGSRADEAVSVCTKEIDECDVLVGVYAWRYGWRPVSGGTSITEQEFDYAQSKKKPCLCYLINENHPWPPPLVDTSEDAVALATFKRKVSALVRSQFTTPDNLSTQIAADLVRELTAHGSAKEAKAARVANPWLGYCGALIEQLSADVALNTAYVPLDATDRAGNSFDLNEEVERWLARKGEPILAILGDYGSGKTTYCRHLAGALARNYIESLGTSALPIFISLRQHRTTATVADMINEILLPFGRTLQELFSAPSSRAVIFLDGLDEQAERFTHAEAKRQFFQLHSSLPATSRVIITSRTHFFRSQVEEDDILAIEDVSHTGLLPQKPKPLPTLYVASLTADKQDQYLQLSQGQRWEKVRQTIDSVYDLRDLSRRPILLHLISQLLDEFEEYEGRIGQAEVYKIATESWIRREQWRGLPDDEIMLFLEGLALSLACENKEALSLHELRIEVVARFQSLILSHVDAEEWEGKVRTSLFFIRDGSGLYSFIHQSFLDYFLARAVLRALHTQESSPIRIKVLSREASQFFHDMMPEETLENVYFMLGDGKYPDAAAVAGELILDRKLPIPFDKDSPYIPHLLKRFSETAYGSVWNAIFWVFEQLKIGDAIPYLIPRLDEHSGESFQQNVLTAIANIGDDRALDDLYRLRMELAGELIDFDKEFGPDYDRIGERAASYPIDLPGLILDWQKKPMEDRFLGSVVLARLNLTKNKYRIWGYTLRDLDDAIGAIRAGRPMRPISHRVSFYTRNEPGTP